jgi:hypothetical protein
MQGTLMSAALIVFAATSPLLAQDDSECRHEAQRSATVDARSARLLIVQAGAGSLKIVGKPGLNNVVARGRACASSAEALQQIELHGRRDGGNVIIEANVSDSNKNWRDQDYRYMRLDIVLEVPARIATEIHDGSGGMDLSNLGATEIKDGSGDIVADNLNGDVDINDGSGGIRLVDVAGRVKIEDGSGEISLRNVGGMIDIQDGSGEIDIRTARNSVRISDSSGSIDVVDVAGDFIVDDDGSGSIDYDNVRGKVDIPRRRK